MTAFIYYTNNLANARLTVVRDYIDEGSTSATNAVLTAITLINAGSPPIDATGGNITFKINTFTVTLSSTAPNQVTGKYNLAELEAAINAQVGGTALVNATDDGGGHLRLTSTNTPGAGDTITVNTFSGTYDATLLGYAAGASATASGANALPAGSGPGQLVIGTSALSGATGVLIRDPLPNPVGTVASRVLTFSGMPRDTSAIAAGVAAKAEIRDSNDVVIAYGLTVGVVGSGAHVIMDTVNITMGRPVRLLAASIVTPSGP